MKTVQQKLDQARRLSAELASIKDPITHARTRRYYFVLRIFQEMRKERNKELDLIRLSKKSEKIKTNPFEEKRAIKEAQVTSTTYERAQKKMFKDLAKWSGRSVI